MSTRFGVLRLILYSSFALSGFAGLIYESIWSHYLKLFLGHAAYAQTIVIALFMGGLSLGSWLASRYSHRWRQLLRRYAVAEAIISILGFLFQPLFEATTGLAYSRLMPALGSPVAVTALKLSLSALMILPPAVVLGMTFPLMSAGVVRLFPRAAGSSISMLYFTNSIGAAVGVLLSGFVLVGRLGLPGTMAMAATINLAVAAIVYVATIVFPPSTQGECGNADEGRPPQPEARRHHHYGLMLWVAALTGLASFIYEIGWIRMLSLVLGSSTHAFEFMLSAFITGLAFGGLWIRSRIDHIAQPTRYLALVQPAMGLLALGTILVYANSFELMREIMKGLNRNDQGYILFNVASHGLALFVMLPATFCAGMTLPLITFALLDGGCGERSIGAVYAANTVGSHRRGRRRHPHRDALARTQGARLARRRSRSRTGSPAVVEGGSRRGRRPARTCHCRHHRRRGGHGHTGRRPSRSAGDGLRRLPLRRHDLPVHRPQRLSPRRQNDER